jgi:hypothetical protein
MTVTRRAGRPAEKRGRRIESPEGGDCRWALAARARGSQSIPEASLNVVLIFFSDSRDHGAGDDRDRAATACAILRHAMCLLLVEDDERLSASLTRGPRGEGYAVDVAATGEDAVFHARVYEYDVVILDVMLPGPRWRERLSDATRFRSVVPGADADRPRRRR